MPGHVGTNASIDQPRRDHHGADDHEDLASTGAVAEDTADEHGHQQRAGRDDIGGEHAAGGVGDPDPVAEEEEQIRRAEGVPERDQAAGEPGQREVTVGERPEEHS